MTQINEIERNTLPNCIYAFPMSTANLHSSLTRYNIRTSADPHIRILPPAVLHLSSISIFSRRRMWVDFARFQFLSNGFRISSVHFDI